MVRLRLAALALLFASPAAAQQCGTLTTCPPVSTPLAGTELLYVVQASVSKKMTVSQLAADIGPLVPLVIGSAISGGSSPNLLVQLTTGLQDGSLGAHLSLSGLGALSTDATGSGILATKGDVTASVAAGLPNLTISQIYGGTGGAGVAQAFPLGTGVSAMLQQPPNASGGLLGYGASAGGDLTGTYPNPTIAANAVTNAKAAQMAAMTFKGNNTGAAANQSDLTVAQTQAVLGAIGWPIPNASWSQQATTGGINVGSSTLTLASAIDYVNGEGVIVNHAGATFSASAPTGLTLTITGSGTTSYAYTIACVDSSGGVGIALANATTSVGPASLNNSTAYVELTWTNSTSCSRYAVYGKQSGSMALLGFSWSNFFYDYGGAPLSPPFWAPSTPPVAALNDWLLTTIVSGSATTSLTLANPAGQTVSSATIVHDDTAAIQAAINALPASGGTVYFDGIANTSDSIAIGNGSAGVASTSTGVLVKGRGAAVNGLGWAAYGGIKGPAINYIGSGSRALLNVKGPLQGWGVENLAFNCNNQGTYGLLITSAQFGDSANLLLSQCAFGIDSTTVPAFSGNNTDSLHNAFRNINIINRTYSQVYAWRMEGDASTGTSDTDYTDAHNVMISGSTTALNVGLDFLTSDSNMFDNVHMSGAWPTLGQAVTFDYADSFGAGSAYPNGNIISKLDPGGAGSSTIIANGTYSGAAGATNQIWMISGANNGTCATPSGVTCHAN